MTYPEAIQFLYGLRLFGTKLGLENTFRLAELCGNPHDRLRFIHVAGTNGKGSTCAMLESIYRAAGFRTGLFTSPHLVSFTERIQVDRQSIGEAAVAREVEEMLRLLEKVNGTDAQEGWSFRPTFFEFVTVLALRYFCEQLPANDSVVIWETGMGGRLDATNIVVPLASVITNIQYDHQKWLGETRDQIAFEKAGIIKQGVPVITAATAPEALEIIRRTAREKAAPLAEVTGLDLRDPFVQKVRLPLQGEHQRWNAAVALATVRALERELPVSHQHIIDGLERVDWPGRQQVVTRGSTRFLLDGAHNPDGAAALRATLQTSFAGEEITLVMGLFEDKDWRGMCEELVPLAGRVLLVPVQSERSVKPERVREFCEGVPGKRQVSAERSLAAALHASEGDRIVVVAGSLHLVGEAMELLGLSASARNERELNEWDAARARK